MPARQCILCSGPVTSRRGEHVLPKWLLRAYDSTSPYFTLEVNGVPEVDRHGKVFRSQESPRVMLRDICDKDDPSRCNWWLDQTFERPAMAAIRKVFELEPIAGVEVVALARWVVKTLLLLAHPATEHQKYRSSRPRAWEPYPDNLLKELRQTGDIPRDLSAWLAVHAPEGGGTQLQVAEPIGLVHTFYNDGGSGGGQGETTNIGLAAADGRMIEFQLVYHPLCVVEHPFEQADLGTRLWPEPPARLDVRAHSTLNVAGVRQWKDTFFIGGGGCGVRPRHMLELAPGAFPKEVCLHLSSEQV